MSDLLPKDSIPVFETIKQIDEKGEYWTARRLAAILDYSDYRNFKDVMLKAWNACKNSGQKGRDHFGKITTMAKIGSGALKPTDDVRLTRYACYLIVQNANPGKEVVALGQTYFAVQTRLREIQQMEEFVSLETEEAKRLFLRKELTEHTKHLASAAKGAGVVDPIDFAVFQNYGYKGLYGGLDKTGIQISKGLSKSSNISDFMGTTELAANLFRATQTHDKLKKDNIKNKSLANQTHFEVGKKVRKTIKEIGGTMPENLPVEENIKHLEAKARKNLPNSQK